MRFFERRRDVARALALFALGYLGFSCVAGAWAGSLALGGEDRATPFAIYLAWAFAGVAALHGALAAVYSTFARRRLAVLSVGAHGIEIAELAGLVGRRVVGGPWRLSRADVASALVMPRSEGAAVELVLARGRVLTIELDDPREGDEVLDAAGFSAAERRASIPLGTARSWAIPAVAVGGVAFFSASLVVGFAVMALPALVPAAPFAWLVIGGVFAALGLSRFAPPGLVVGVDGVTIRRPGRHLFVPMSALERAEVRFGCLRLCLRDGSVRWVAGIELDRGRVAAAALRVAEAIDLYERAPDGAFVGLLERRGRTLQAWRSHFVGVLRGAAGYRRIALSLDDCASTLANPRATEEHRLGAALALDAIEDPEASDRIRAAARVCASVPLRVALERVAEGDLDDDTLAAALDEARHAAVCRA